MRSELRVRRPSRARRAIAAARRTALASACLGLGLGLALLLPGCDGGGGGTAARAEAAAPVVEAPPRSVPVDAPSPEPQAIVAFHARLLAADVGLDADGEARVAEILERSWTAAQADVQGRIDAALPVDEEAVSELLLARQRQADLEIAALLTPAQRARFEALGGRIGADAIEPVASPAGGVR